MIYAYIISIYHLFALLSAVYRTFYLLSFDDTKNLSSPTLSTIRKFDTYSKIRIGESIFLEFLLMLWI